MALLFSLLQTEVTHLDPELPNTSDGDARDWAVVVGRDNGALLAAANTSHALIGEEVV